MSDNHQPLYCVSSRQVSSDIGDEVVIMQMESGLYHGAQGVAAFIWKLLQSPISLQSIVEQVCGEYDVGAQQCKADVQHLFTVMQAQGLIDEMDPAREPVLRA